MGRTSRIVGVSLVVAAGALGAAFVAACAATPDPKRQTDMVQPSRADFVAVVSPMLELRCGSLDCHGTVGRPMRIYSSTGLRMPVEAGTQPYPGGGATSNDERNANYDAVIGVQPEFLSRVVADGGGQPQDTYLVGKAVGLIQHKGGKIFGVNDPGGVCLQTWLTGQQDGLVNKDACNTAAKL